MTKLTDAERAANRWEIWSEKYPNAKWWDAESEDDAQQECARLNSGFGNARPFYIRRFSVVELSPAATTEQGLGSARPNDTTGKTDPVSAPVSTSPASDATAALLDEIEERHTHSHGDCGYCQRIWPCDAQRLARALRAEQEKVKAFEGRTVPINEDQWDKIRALDAALRAEQGKREKAERVAQALAEDCEAEEQENARLQQRVATFEALAVRATVTKNSPHAVNLRYLVVDLSALAPTADAKEPA